MRFDHSCIMDGVEILKQTVLKVLEDRAKELLFLSLSVNRYIEKIVNIFEVMIDILRKSLI